MHIQGLVTIHSTLDPAVWETYLAVVTELTLPALTNAYTNDYTLIAKMPSERWSSFSATMKAFGEIGQQGIGFSIRSLCNHIAHFPHSKWPCLQETAQRLKTARQREFTNLPLVFGIVEILCILSDQEAQGCINDVIQLIEADTQGDNDDERLRQHFQTALTRFNALRVDVINNIIRKPAA